MLKEYLLDLSTLNDALEFYVKNLLKELIPNKDFEIQVFIICPKFSRFFCEKEEYEKEIEVPIDIKEAFRIYYESNP